MFGCFCKGKGKGKGKGKIKDGEHYICDICGKELPTRSDLNIHKSDHYRPLRSLLCDYPQCGLAFHTKQGLIAHKRIHFGRDAGSSSQSGVLVHDFDHNQPPSN